MFTIKTFNNSRNGVTLIELLLTIAILSIIITAISSLFIYNTRVYSRSENLSQVQFDVRMASHHILKEIRNTEKVSLSDNTLANSLDLASLQTKYASIKNVDFELKFHGSQYFLTFIIKGSDSNSQNEYLLSNEIILNNINNAVIGAGNVVYFE